MSLTTPSFRDLPYVRPDLDAVRTEIESISTSIDGAASAADVIEHVHSWNAIRTRFGTMHSLAEVHYTQNVANDKAKEEKHFYDLNTPTVEDWNLSVSKRLIGSPFRPDIEREFGSLFLKRLEQGTKTFDPSIKDFLVEESDLCNRYNEITASARIELDGEVYNLSSIAALVINLDRDKRRRATKAMYDFLHTHREELEHIYDRLVQVRTQKAQKLGFSSYTEYRYIEFGRIDYDQNHVEAFRRQVIDHVVPLVTKLRKAQAERLGLDTVTLYDEKLQFVDGNPIAQGDHDWIVERAQRMYSELSGQTKEFFELMLDHDLMDLKTRDNKATGGYCTSFAEFGLPFIFANFNRTTHDIEVLTHEAGHAFQAYRSRGFEVPEYRWPTAEACEIHSMGMEFLTWPWMQSFFGEQTDKFRFYHLQGALLFLPYGCAVDHFQHWIYAHPDATPAERNEAWREMEGTYMPWRTADDVPYAQEGTQWQFQRHIYESPFYYIDYALAQTCALQYWKRSLEDRDKAFADYLRICDIGGSMPFLDIVKAGALVSPFADGCLKDIVDTAYAWLSATYPNYLGKA